MKRNILSFMIVCLIGAFSWGAGKSQKTFIKFGGTGKTLFKNEVTIFEAEEDPQPKCIGCKNYRVILDILGEPGAPVGGRYPSAVAFNTEEACGEDAEDSPVAELNMLYQSSNSPLMTRSHPLMLQMNPNLCNKGKKITLNILSKDCSNPMAACGSFVTMQHYEIPIEKFKTDLEDINLAQDPYPNLKKGKKIRQLERDPSSVKPVKK